MDASSIVGGKGIRQAAPTFPHSEQERAGDGGPGCVSSATACSAAHTLRFPTSRKPRLISAFCDGYPRAISLAGGNTGEEYDATQFVRKSINQSAEEVSDRRRGRLDQEPDCGRAGSARHVCRRDRHRQLLAQQHAGSGTTSSSTNPASFRPRGHSPGTSARCCGPGG